MTDTEETPPGTSPVATPEPRTNEPATARRGVWLRRWLGHPIDSLRAAPPSAITWLGIAALVVAIVLSVLAYRPGSPLDGYDVQAAILAITAVSLFFTAQVTREATNYQRHRDAIDRRERRRALAEALISELEMLESRTVAWKANMFEARVPVAIEHPVLDLAVQSASLFEMGTVLALARMLRVYAELRTVIPIIHDVLPRVPPDRDDQRQRVTKGLEQLIDISGVNAKRVIVALTNERDRRDD